MKNRITDLFAKKTNGVLSVYYTAGFPALTDTVRIAMALERAGADMIEIGIPFSDPVADGPTIQQSNKIALDNGMNLHLLVDQVKEIRRTIQLPIVLMGYLNPVLQYGVENFVADASAAGVDGLIIPDMPIPEYEQQYYELFRASSICNTFLISPTTGEDRIRRIDAATEGFIYAVSASSTTGAKRDFAATQISYFERVKALRLRNPILIGFGISDQQTFSKACEYAAGAIVGSAFITMLKQSNDIDADIASFVTTLKSGK